MATPCAVFLVAAGTVAGCASALGSTSHRSAGAPTTPIAVPVGTTDHCLLTRSSADAQRGGIRAAVDPDPVGVSVVWYPGMNRTRCTEPVTTGGAARATRLARDIRAAKPYALGVRTCAMDVARAAELFFVYRRPARTERVVVTLTGCSSIHAPGHGLSLDGSAVVADLAPLTPPDLRAG